MIRASNAPCLPAAKVQRKLKVYLKSVQRACSSQLWDSTPHSRLEPLIRASSPQVARDNASGTLWLTPRPSPRRRTSPGDLPALKEATLSPARAAIDPLANCRSPLASIPSEHVTYRLPASACDVGGNRCTASTVFARSLPFFPPSPASSSLFFPVPPSSSFLLFIRKLLFIKLSFIPGDCMPNVGWRIFLRMKNRKNRENFQPIWDLLL